MTMYLDYVNELHTVYEVKVALCFLLEKIPVKVPEQELDKLIFDLDFINYFLYAEALEELIINDSLARVNGFIELREKGREAADVLKKSVHFHYRKRLVEAAFRYNFEREVEQTVKVSIEKANAGVNVNAVIGDGKLELLKMSVYAPDMEQAEFISSKIKANPVEFYRTVLDTLLKQENSYEKTQSGT
jgi:hypothetical protein